MRWTGRLVAILLFLVPATVVALPGSAASGSDASQSVPTVLALDFRQVVPFTAGSCGGFWTSGRYVLVSISAPTPYACATTFVLIDDQTRKHTFIHRRGFTSVLAFGAPWILWNRNGTYELYNFVTKKTQIPALPNGTAVSYAVGRRWLETFIQQPGPCGDGVHNGCGPITEHFSNIQTGHFLRSSSSSSTTIADLNSRRLFQHVCPPLQVPPGGPLGGIYQGTAVPRLTLYGNFAVATPTGQSWLLERCGSTLQMPIGMSVENGPVSPPVVSSHAVVWKVLDSGGFSHGQLAGVLLPSLQPFTATIPSNLSQEGFLGLSAFRLYVFGQNGSLWAASVPR